MRRLTPCVLAIGLEAVGGLLLPTTAGAGSPTNAACIGANNSAIDLRNDHKLRAALAQLVVCAAATCRSDVRKECSRQADEVSAAIPTIVFEVKDGTGNSLRAVKVTMDGEVLAEKLDGTPLPVDPGDHAFTFEAEGQPPTRKSFIVPQGQKDRHEVVTFEPPAPPPCAPGLERMAPSNECVKPPPPACAADTQWSEPAKQCIPIAKNGGLGTQRILAIATGGIGVVGVGLGSAFGFAAMSKKSDAQNVCPAKCETQAGVNKWSDAKAAAQLADVFFVVGGLGLVAGTALWWTAPASSPGEQHVQVGFGLGSLQMRSVW